MLSKNNRMRIVLLLSGLIIFSVAVGVDGRISGISGRSQTGCTCHGPGPGGVSVAITGIPPNYVPGNTYPLVVTVSGGPPTTNGGFDLSVTAGILSTSDPNAQILAGEATHTNNLARSWTVSWQAPTVGPMVVTFNVAGNAVDGDGTPGGDSWALATYTTAPILINQPPTITLTSPDGSQDWTGGTPHTVTWTMNDDTTPPANLVVYLNYTSSSGSGPIAGPLIGVTSHDWNVPPIDALDTRVNATVIDANGLRGFSEAPVPKIDSTAPAVLSASPTGTSVAIVAPVIVQFSETMNKSSVEASFSTIPAVSNWAFVWSQTSVADDTMTATHDPFAPSTTYVATIATGAKDVSAPGNPLATSHQWQFTTTFVNTPPTIVLSRPIGGVGLTGGSAHNVVWTADDAQDPVASLTVWVNYSLTGVAPFNQQIHGLQGVSGASSPFAWTLPPVNSTSVVLNATVVDTAGAKGYGLSAPFEIDSASPVIILLTPQDMAGDVPTNTNVQISWSEPMNKTSTEPAFSLQDTATWTAVVGSISWAGNVMIFDPSASLSPTRQYQGNLTATASDDSIPGNPLGTDLHWSFTTSDAADLTPPTISVVTSVPNPQNVGHSVNVSVVVQDDVAVGPVWLNLTPPVQSATNVTMAFSAVSGRFYVNRTYDILGTHNFVIWASDSSGNWASSSGQFVISDFIPPAAPINLIVESQGSNDLKLTWTANSEPDLAGYKIYRSDQAGGPYTLLNTGALVTLNTYTDSGLQGGKTYYYVVRAVDTSGNESAPSNEALGHIEATDGVGLTATDWMLVSIIVVIPVVVTLLALLLRRRKMRKTESAFEQSSDEETR